MKTLLAFVLISVCAVSCSMSISSNQHSYMPEGGFVPDAETAKQIAEVVVTRIYGREVINSEKPFDIVFKDDRWIVRGTLPANTPGGVFVAEIARSDGRIIRVSHTK